jgi:hypothetical protein
MQAGAEDAAEKLEALLVSETGPDMRLFSAGARPWQQPLQYVQRQVRGAPGGQGRDLGHDAALWGSGRGSGARDGGRGGAPSTFDGRGRAVERSSWP